MEIIPRRQEYVFSVMKHTMRAVVEHEQDKRNLSYYFDEKLVATKVRDGGNYYTDDDCIREVVDDYRKNNTGVYADLFNRHTDKIYLTTKLLEVDLVNSGIVIRAKVKIVRDYYEIELATDNGNNQFTGRFKAASFSEVLEKMRLFTSTLEGVSFELAQNISILSNDKIEEIIKWQEDTI
ncbi:MAG: hypothetical protein MJ133_09895 [Lachnospiraceae bacterium]|nr:hypothetical protein [Lachnospiraceae bacterium]